MNGPPTTEEGIDARVLMLADCEIDQDRSGVVTYDELLDVVRHKLEIKASVLSTNDLKALWCALDTDDSNQLTPEEMGKFFKRGEVDRKARSLQRQQTIILEKRQTLGRDAMIAASNRALDSQPTSEMRKELEASGVPIPHGEALIAHSRRFNEWLEECRYAMGLAASSTWFNLYTVIDEDRSGVVTYDELLDVLRHKCEIGPSVLSTNDLKALWCALDTDDSNQLTPEEMGVFFKRGEKDRTRGLKRQMTSTKSLNAGSVSEAGVPEMEHELSYEDMYNIM